MPRLAVSFVSVAVVVTFLLLCLAPPAIPSFAAEDPSQHTVHHPTVRARFHVFSGTDDPIALVAQRRPGRFSRPLLERSSRARHVANPRNAPVSAEDETNGSAIAALTTPLAANVANEFTFFRRRPIRHRATHGLHYLFNSPSVANIGPSVVFTGNFYASISANSGRRFEYLNPHSQFPEEEIALSEEQVVLSDPDRGTLFWLQGGIVCDGNCADATDLSDFIGSMLRLSVDQDFDGEPECSYDYPDMAFADLQLSEGHLFVSASVCSVIGACLETVLIRVPRSAVASCAPQIVPDVDVGEIFGSEETFRAASGAKDVMYYGRHGEMAPVPPDLQTVEVCAWPDASPEPQCVASEVPQWNSFEDTEASCPGPGGDNWCGEADATILGAYVANGVVGLMWMAAQGGGFQFPYVQVARFNQSDLTLIDAPAIWSPNYAVAYPSVAVNARGHLGGTFLRGGGSFYPTCSAWIADDVNDEQLSPTEFYDIARSTVIRGDMGYYLTARAHSAFANTWIGTCYTVHGGQHIHAGDPNSPYPRVRPRFVWFGRKRDRACVPGSCGNFNRHHCGPDDECTCFKLVDGSGFCSPTELCADLAPCAVDLTCPAGYVCEVDTCCGEPKCKALSKRCGSEGSALGAFLDRSSSAAGMTDSGLAATGLSGGCLVEQSLNASLLGP